MHEGASLNPLKASLQIWQMGKILPQLREGVQKLGSYSPVVPHLLLRTLLCSLPIVLFRIAVPAGSI